MSFYANNCDPFKSPTMPSLAQNCNVSTAEVSIVFTYRSIGVFVAAVLAGAFFPKLGEGKININL